MNSTSLDLQLKLLRLAKDDSTSTFSTASKLSDDLLSARFKDVLLSTYARSLFSSTARTGTEDLWSSVGLTRSDKAVSNEQQLSIEEEQICRLVVAIACLHAFLQLNWTGPALNFTTKDLLAGCTTNSDEADLNIALHNATIPLLALDGEPAYHLAQEPTLLLFALRIIETLQAESSENLVTLPWWTLRIGLVHRALLDEPVNFSSDLFSSLDTILSSSNPLSALLTADDKVALHTEIGLANHLLGMDKQASERFLSAAKESGLEWALTGALGKRTKFQVKELSQLVLVAKSRKREGDEVDQPEEHAEAAKEKEEVAEVKENGTDEEERVPNLKLPGMPETLALNDDTLLEQTQFTSSSLDYAGLGAELAPIKAAAALPESLRELNPQDQPALHPLDQALLIDMCLAQHNNTPENGLTASQMAPFLARVLTHPKNWSVHTTALLLRARLESKRSRTIERSALQLQALVDQMPTADSEPSERLRYFHQLPLVSKWEMERELAVRFLGMGVVRTALEIFERLEMWEEAVRCHHSMEDTDKAIRVVKDLLEGKKAEPEIVQKREKVQRSEDEAGRKETKRIRIDNTREAKLWCLLGDLEPDNAEAHYEKAWEVSKGTSSRSQRSLGGIYLTREEFTKAIPRFQAALKINPLYARTWFALGCCLLREERLEEAREAFSRNVAVEEDDAEAWNNLAAVYLRLTREIGVVKADDGEEQSVPFTNKQLAFKALQHGLRHASDNSKMWQNYMIVAVDVGQLSEAARALSRTIESKNARDAATQVDLAVLSKLVDAVIREDWNGGAGNRSPDQPYTSNEGMGLLPIVERLFEVVILPRVVETSRIYAIYAKLFRWKEDWAGALECYMKAYRSGIASDETVERELPRFKDATEDLEELVDVMRLLGPRAKEQEAAQGLEKGKAKWSDWKFQARTMIRTFQGRTKDTFGDEPEFERLKDVLAELRS